MKKVLILLILLIAFWSITAGAQDTKPGKFRINSGFLSEKYEIGDTDATKQEVNLHLDKFDTQASNLFRRGSKLQTNASLWILAGSASLLGAVLSDKPSTSLAWGVSAVTCSGIGLVMELQGGSKKRNSVSLYNHKFGYN